MTIVTPPEDGSNGIGPYAHDLADRLEAEGTEVSFVTLPHESRNPFAFALAAYRGATDGSDVVHVQHEYGLFGPLAAFTWVFFPVLWVVGVVRGSSVVVTVHEGLNPELVGDSLQWLKRWYIWSINRLVSASADHLVFLSGQARDRFRPNPRTPSTLLAHGVPVDATMDLSRSEAREALGVDEDATLVVEPGWVSPQKGSDVLVDVAKRLPQYEFLLAGGHPDSDSPYLKRIESQTLANLRVTGHLPEAQFHAAFVAADLVVLPYRTVEMSGIVNKVNQSGVFNWCVAYGLPVVASDTDHFQSTADEWGFPAVEPEDDPDAFAERIDELLTDDEQRSRLASATGRYRDRYDLRSVAEEHTDLYARVRQ